MLSPSLLSLLLLLAPAVHPLNNKAPSPCRPDILATYRLVLTTHWNEETFPKQYPQWRPPAQWSKTMGYSHTDQFSLFSLGKPVGEGVKQFVESGDTTGLDTQVESRSLLDSFTVAPVMSGSGNSSARIFLDGRHTRVSLITKLVPSPDWFIGLDSLNLCQGGRFIDSLMLEADPLDAGTDNGFTFTSPNWPTDPQGVAFRISNTYPSHPAGSFHYPHLAKLPTIATFQFIKEAEYSLSHQFAYEMKMKRYEYNVGNRKNDEKEFIFVPMTEVPRRKRKLTERVPLTAATETSVQPPIKVRLHTGYNTPSAPTNFLQRQYSSLRLSKVNGLSLPGSLNSLDKAELYENILKSYPTRTLSKGRRKRLRGGKKGRKHKKKRKDCRVSKWGSWGSCSRTCGIGEMVRSRAVKAASRQGGRPCPSLTEYKWCGSARNCKEGYFDW